nr:hypothetical protein P5648_09060 [Bacillus subtilis]
MHNGKQPLYSYIVSAE